MCDFITATLPKRADHLGLRPIVQRHHLDFTPIANPVVLAQLRPGETLHRATGSVCDCGTGLGSLAADATGPDPDAVRAKKVRRLEAKGWGKAKIARWHREQERAEAKRERADLHRHRLGWGIGNFRSDADRWLAIVREMIESTRTPTIGLLVHWYSGGLESEPFKILQRITTRLDDATTDTLLHMEHDTLYEFRS